MEQSCDDRVEASCRTLRSSDNQLKLRVRRMRHADVMYLQSRSRPGTQAEENARIVHRAWDQLARTAPPLATALELREYGKLNVRGVAAAMGRSLQTGAFYLRLGEVHLERSIRADEAAERSNGGMERFTR